MSSTYGKSEQWKKTLNENMFLKVALEEKDAEIETLKRELNEIKSEFILHDYAGHNRIAMNDYSETQDAEIVEEPITGNTCWRGPGHDPSGNEY